MFSFSCFLSCLVRVEFNAGSGGGRYAAKILSKNSKHICFVLGNFPSPMFPFCAPITYFGLVFETKFFKGIGPTLKEYYQKCIYTLARLGSVESRDSAVV